MILEHVRSIDPEAPPVSPSDDLLQIPRLGSLAVLETVVWMEGAFSFVVPDEELIAEDFATVEAMTAYALRRDGTE